MFEKRASLLNKIAYTEGLDIEYTPATEVFPTDNINKLDPEYVSIIQDKNKYLARLNATKAQVKKDVKDHTPSLAKGSLIGGGLGAGLGYALSRGVGAKGINQYAIMAEAAIPGALMGAGINYAKQRAYKANRFGAVDTESLPLTSLESKLRKHAAINKLAFGTMSGEELALNDDPEVAALGNRVLNYNRRLKALDLQYANATAPDQVASMQASPKRILTGTGIGAAVGALATPLANKYIFSKRFGEDVKLPRSVGAGLGAVYGGLGGLLYDAVKTDKAYDNHRKQLLGIQAYKDLDTLPLSDAEQRFKKNVRTKQLADNAATHAQALSQGQRLSNHVGGRVNI